MASFRKSSPFLQLPVVPQAVKQDQINEAKKQEQAIEAIIKRNPNVKPLNYELLELIGKGAYGRVYKASVSASFEVWLLICLLESTRRRNSL